MYQKLSAYHFVVNSDLYKSDHLANFYSKQTGAFYKRAEMYYLLISVVIVQNICYGSGENLILEHIQKAVEDENSTISENCKLHLWTYLTALNNSETWALESKSCFVQ